MSALDDILGKLITIRDTLPDIAVSVLEDAAPQIEDKITQQLQQGKRGDGSTLPNYSPVSVAKFGKPPGPIKLFDTGDFYQGIKVSANGSGLFIDDTDSKTPLLTEKYGDAILYLGDDSLAELKEDVFLPGILYEIEQILAA